MKTKRYPLAKDPSTMVQVLRSEEKRSDVNLAVHLVRDGFQGRYQKALLISNDVDLVEAVKTVRDIELPLVLLSPAQYPASELSKYATSRKIIDSAGLEASRFPTQLKDCRGSFHIPPEWL